MEGDEDVEEGGALMDLSAAGVVCKKNMKKRSRAEALPIFYWAWQLMPASLVK